MYYAKVEVGNQKGEQNLKDKQPHNRNGFILLRDKNQMSIYRFPVPEFSRKDCPVVTHKDTKGKQNPIASPDS